MSAKKAPLRANLDHIKLAKHFGIIAERPQAGPRLGNCCPSSNCEMGAAMTALILQPTYRMIAPQQGKCSAVRISLLSVSRRFWSVQFELKEGRYERQKKFL